MKSWNILHALLTPACTVYFFRYLYVNCRQWPKNYTIENPFYPPPIAQEIDIHVIDLMKMKRVGTMHQAHKAYTSRKIKKHSSLEV